MFLKVRDEIQTGNLAIDGAKNFGRFEAFFLPAAQWEQVREAREPPVAQLDASPGYQGSRYTHQHRLLTVTGLSMCAHTHSPRCVHRFESDFNGPRAPLSDWGAPVFLDTA